MTNNFFMTTNHSIKQIASDTPRKHIVELIDEAFDNVKYNLDYDLIN